MFDDLQDLFGHADAFGPPARRSAPPFSDSPFVRLHPEDRKALARPDTLRSPLVRRWLNFPDPAPESPKARQAAPAGVPAAEDRGRYEVLAGWQVPSDWDLKDLGRAALDNATKAGSPDGDRPAAPPLAAASGVDAHGPDGGRSVAGQVRAAKTIRARAANARPEPLKKPAAAKASHTGLQSPAASGRNPALGPQRSEKGPAPGDIENSVTGPAADLPAALWREIGSRLLDTRNLIKQTSIDLEQQAGDDAKAHDAGVIATAQSADPKLPGNTERATVNSVLLAGAKYRQNRAARAKENETAAPLAAYRNRYLTFEREAAHARDKALRARFAGDDLAARRYERDAEGYRNAAEATLDDARNAGIDPQQVEAEDAGSGDGSPDPAIRENEGDAAGKEEPAGGNATGVEEDPAGGGAGGEESGTADWNGGDESALRQQLIERQRTEKTADLKRRLHVRDPQALIAAVADVRTALKQAGDDPRARKAALAAFDSRLKAVGAGIAAAEALKPMVRDRAFASGTAAAEDVVFRALTGSTPKAAAEREQRERRNRALEAERQARAAAAKARLKAQRTEATKQFAPIAASLKDPAKRQDALRQGFAIARKQGAMPLQLAVWLEKRLAEPASGWAPKDYASDSRPGLTVAAAAEVERLRREHPEIWGRLPASARRKAAAIRAVQAGAEFGAPIDAAASPDDRARAILMQADRALREIGGELHRKAARQAIREGFDLLTDFAPIVGDIKAIVEARDFLRQAEAAEKAGDSDKAAKLRGLAGISIATILPWMRGLRAVKAVARIFKVSAKLKASADPVIVRLNKFVPDRVRDRLPNRRTSAIPDNHPDLDRFKGDFAHSPTTLDFRAKFEADAEWQKHRVRTKGLDEQGREYKGEPINGLKEGNVARIGDVRLFERNGESYARGLDGIERKIDRKPKAGKGLPVDNKPHLEKDVIYGESRDGGRVIEIAMRDKNTGKEVFRNSVYYNRYGVPEFEAKGSFWLPPEEIRLGRKSQRTWVQDQLREMAQDRKRWLELRRMGFASKQIEILRVKGYNKDLGVRIHHDYQLGRIILVDTETHTRFAHVGGGKLWGTK